MHKEILGSSDAERLRFPGLDARRVDLIVAGSMVLATAMELFDLDTLTISEWALREGIVLDARGAAPRRRLVRATRTPSGGSRSSGSPRRCNWAEAHARKVAGLALELFDATADAARARRRRP